MSSQIIAEDVETRRFGEIDSLEVDVQRQLIGRVSDFRLVLFTEGLVLLGTAASFHAKQLAQHAVMAATQLPIFANDIAVHTDVQSRQ